MIPILDCVFQIDDFFAVRNQLTGGFRYLDFLKERYPQFKVTLNTIAGRSSPQALQYFADLGWIELDFHGWLHLYGQNYPDLLRIQLEKVDECFDRRILARIYKPPGTAELKEDALEVLRDFGYACNSAYTPSKIIVPTYLSAECPWEISLHPGAIGSTIQRGAEVHPLFEFFSDRTKFYFVSEILGDPAFRSKGWVLFPEDR